MIIGRNLIDEEYYDERLYSTGDYELDDLLEKAFCDGYEYAQREFANSVKFKEGKQQEGLKGFWNATRKQDLDWYDKKIGSSEYNDKWAKKNEKFINSQKGLDKATNVYNKYANDLYKKRVLRNRALVVAPVVATGTAAGIAIHKHRKNKRGE